MANMQVVDGAGSTQYIAGGGAGTDSNPLILNTVGTVVTVSRTRPADTAAYSAGDAVMDSTSSPTVMTFASCARHNNGAGKIESAILIGSEKQVTLPELELWLFDTTFTPDNDNAAFTPTDAEMLTLVGVINFHGSAAAADQVFEGTGSGNCVYYPKPTARNLPIYFKCGASAQDLYGCLVIRNAYTPVSAEVFTVRLGITQVG